MRVIGSLVAAFCFALAAFFLAQASLAESRSFAAPEFNGTRLDWCLRWARDCGKPAADYFCRAQGFTQASQFHIDANAGARGVKTLVAGDGRVCAAPTCTGFRLIVCERADISAGPIIPPAGKGKPAPGTSQVSPTGPSIRSYEDLNNDLRSCRADGDKLRDQVQTLLGRKQYLEKTLAERDKTIGDMTRKGGSLVRAYCQGYSCSKNTAGATTYCGAYQCEAVSGLCQARCTNTANYCNYGHVCDPDKGVCIFAENTAELKKQQAECRP